MFTGKKNPRRIHAPWIIVMNRARSSLTTRRKTSNKRCSKARMARAQVLALCCALIVIGWSGGSTGPLLPKFIGIFLSTSHEFCRSVLELYECILGICLAMHNQSLMIIGWCWWLPTTLDHFFQGVVVGAFLNMPLSDRQGLWIIDFLNLKLTLYHQMLVVGPLFRTAAFLVRFLELPFLFPIFA